jgi:hypothetical protein
MIIIRHKFFNHRYSKLIPNLLNRILRYLLNNKVVHIYNKMDSKYLKLF